MKSFLTAAAILITLITTSIFIEMKIIPSVLIWLNQNDIHI